MDTSRLTARFGRWKGGKPAVEAKTPAAVPAPAVASEAATPASPAPPVDVVAERAAAPDPLPASRGSRLVEGERPKPAGRPPFAPALAWMAGAAARAKPATKPLAGAAALVVALGAGYGIGTVGRTGDGQAVSAARWLEATAELRQASGDIVRLAADVKGVKAAVDGLKSEREKAREVLARQAQLERAGQETTTRLTRLGEQIDRIEKQQRDPARLSQVTERLDRIERGLAAHVPTPPSKPVAAAAPATPDVTQTGSLAEARPARPESARPEGARAETAKPDADPRRTQIEGYFVRDYEDGYALVETKAGRYIDVAVGYSLPGIGRVEAIERRGRQWVVVTPKGYIGER